MTGGRCRTAGCAAGCALEDRLPGDQEKALIQALGTDPGAMDLIYRLYAGRLYRYASALTGDSEAAQDAVQETMLAAWRNSASFDGRSRPLTWLVSICRNKVVDMMRRKGRREVPVHCPEDTAFNQMGIAVGAKADFWDAFGRLPREQREVLLLVFYSGFSQEEVTRILGIPRGTVRSRVYRARKNLQAYLQGVDSYDR